MNKELVTIEPATDAFHAAHPIESMFFCEKVESAAALVRSPRMKAGSLPGWFPAPRGDDWEIRYSLDWTAEDSWPKMDWSRDEPKPWERGNGSPQAMQA